MVVDYGEGWWNMVEDSGLRWITMDGGGLWWRMVEDGG